MLKKLLVAILFVVPAVTISAQAAKYGHFNSQEVLMMMPEVKEIEKKLDDLQGVWEGELLKLREEYNAKIAEYQEKQATMIQSVRELKQGEIAEMEQRIVTFNQQASQDLQRQQQELLMPVLEKMKKAIDEVGEANSFTYIFDLAAQSIVYTGKDAQDVSSLIKAKLGI